MDSDLDLLKIIVPAEQLYREGMVCPVFVYVEHIEHSRSMTAQIIVMFSQSSSGDFAQVAIRTDVSRALLESIDSFKEGELFSADLVFEGGEINFYDMKKEVFH